MFRRFPLFLWPIALALLASPASLAWAGDINGAPGTGGFDPAAADTVAFHAAPVPEPTAAALLAIGGGLAVMAVLRKPPQE